MTKKNQEKLGDIIEVISNMLIAENLPMGLPQKHTALVAKVKVAYVELRELYSHETGNGDPWQIYDEHIGIRKSNNAI